MRCPGMAKHPELIVAGVTHLLINAEHMLFPNFMLFDQVWTGQPLLGRLHWRLAIAATIISEQQHRSVLDTVRCIGQLCTL